MASLSSVNRSNGNYLSSLMNSANTITGLASGLDTESMIESLVQSYQAKINQYNQKITKVEWKQDAYRSIISKMVSFADKYTSYTSSTNLLSRSFFNNSVNVSALGKFAEAVTASGKTSSNVSLNAVHQLATAAKYRTSSNMSDEYSKSIEASRAVDLYTTTTKSTLDGDMKLDYGGKSVKLSFGKSDVADIEQILRDHEGEENFTKTDALVELINRKLGENDNITVEDENGEKTTLIRAEKEGNGIKFVGTDNEVSISSVDGNLAEKLGIDEEALNSEDGPKVSSFGTVPDELTYQETSFNSALSRQSMSITLNGVTKTINLPTIVSGKDGEYFMGADGKPIMGEEIGEDGEPLPLAYTADNYAKLLNDEVQKAFGGKVTVSNESGETDKLKLNFTVNEDERGSTLSISGDAGDALGIGKNASNYINTNKTLGELLGSKLDGLDAVTDKDGNPVLDEDGNKQYQFKINGVVVGTYTSNSTLSDVLSGINNSSAGVKVSYSQTTQNFLFESKETGADSRIDFGEGLAAAMFETDAAESEYTPGQDAIFNVTVNGETMQMTRSSNTVDIDGLTITMKDTFNSVVNDEGKLVEDTDGRYKVENPKESVTFKTSTDTDKIVDTIKTVIDEYNAMLSEIKAAYSTMPYQNSNGALSTFEPLTDEEMEGMSESAIARYEEKAKQGLLFGDRTLAELYGKMTEVFSFNNTADVSTLREMGISINFNLNDGSQAVTLDEEKLRAMLDSDPDRVTDMFTKSGGIMDRMKTQLDNYAKTTGEPKGILIQQAGSPLSSMSLLSNNWQTEIDNYNKQIERWQSKLESQVERYTSQFARLEQLINQMNSQSSALAGMLGG